MKAFVTAAGAAALLLALTPAPAAAKAGDAAWAKCVWTTAPQAAEAWLAMDLPKWSTDFAAPSVLLGHRLLATCDETAVNPLKANRMPKWSSVASALRKAKSKEGSGPASPGTAVALCQTRVEQDGKWFVYLYEIVRQDGAAETVAFQQYYTEQQGQALKLPQDLRVVPPPGAATERTCQSIGDKGGLSDA